MSKTIEIKEEEYKELKEYSRKLGIVGMYVEDFLTENSEETVLIGVLRLRSKYYDCMAEIARADLDEHLKNEKD